MLVQVYINNIQAKEGRLRSIRARILFQPESVIPITVDNASVKNVETWAHNLSWMGRHSGHKQQRL